MVSEDSVHPVTSTLVLPLVAVKLLRPSLSVAPTGMAPIWTASVSEPSVSVKAGSTASAIALSSSPGRPNLQVGASATARTAMLTVAFDACPPPSATL